MAIQLNRKERSILVAALLHNMSGMPRSEALQKLVQEGSNVQEHKHEKSNRAWLGKSLGDLNDADLVNTAQARQLPFTSAPQRISHNWKQDSRQGLWHLGRIRTFLSHISAEKVFAAEVSEALYSFGLSGFVAHEDIEPGSLWEATLQQSIGEMELLVALLHEGYHASNWTDQEVGAAVGRGLQVIPVTFPNGQVPYGFIGKFQTLKAGRMCARQLAKQIAILAARGSTTAQFDYADVCVELLEAASSYDGAADIAEVIDSVPVLNGALVDRVEAARYINDQIGGRSGLPVWQRIMKKHRSAALS